MAEALKATFFTLRRRDRRVLAPATLAFLVIAALIISVWAALNWGVLAQLFAITREQPDQVAEARAAALFAGMMGLFGSTILLLFPFYIALAAYEAACLRWMIRGETSGLFGLALDHDTWRVYGVYWCWFLTHLVIGFAASMLMMPFMFMMMGEVISQGPEFDPQAMWQMQIKMQLLSLIQYVPLAFVGVRLAPAAATSIAKRQFSFFEAWNVTQGRFWALFGSFAVLMLTFFIASGVLFTSAYAVILGDLLPSFAAAWPGLPTEAVEEIPRRVFSPRGLTLVVSAYLGVAILWLGYNLMSYGVNARAILAALDEGKIRAPAETPS